MTDEPENMRWHQIVAPILKEELDEYHYDVLPELDVTHRQVVDASIDLIHGERRPSEGELRNAPDGFQELNQFNPCSIKFDEPFNADALDELISYSVLFRKVRAKKDQKGRPQWSASRELVSLYAICGRKPSTENLHECLVEQLPGVYHLPMPGRYVTVIVPWQTAQIPRNAIWHLISGRPPQVQFGIENFDWNEHTNGHILNRLIKHYHLKGIDMAATVEDYLKRWKEEDTFESINENPKLLANSRISGTVADFLETNPEILANNPKILANNPKILENNPEILANNPKILENNPEILANNPEILENNPEILANNQGLMFSALGKIKRDQIDEYIHRLEELKSSNDDKTETE